MYCLVCGKVAYFGITPFNPTHCEFHCNNRALYGLFKPTNCEKHSDSGLTKLIQRKCISPFCNVDAQYGHYARLYCGTHKTKHMYNFDKLCTECGRLSTYEDLKCDDHALVSSIREVYRYENKCIKCDRDAAYGFTYPTHCSDHKLDNMFMVFDRRCVVCNRKALFGYIVQDYCEFHIKPGMICLEIDICMRKDCNAFAKYGYQFPDYCEKHKKCDMIHVKKAKCVVEDCCNKVEQYCGIYCELHRY